MESNVITIFSKYNEKYFKGILSSVQVSWSSRMTLCSGKTYFKQRNNEKKCLIKLSKPLLTQRPFQDTVNTLLHEMIHAFLFLKFGRECGNSHGEDFKYHMNKINQMEGTKIRIFHNFVKEVNKFRVHIYKCNGPCRFKKPFFGTIRRAITRPPGPEDKWWSRHKSECGGTFSKVGLTPSGKSNDPPSCIKTMPATKKNLLKRKAETDYENHKSYCLSKSKVNANYSSSVKCLNIKKYINKYVEYNEKASYFVDDSKVSKFRQALNLNVEKYIRNTKDALKINASNIN